MAAKEIAVGEEGNAVEIDDFIDTDSTKVSWSPNLKTELRQGRTLSVEDGQFLPCMYRPFTKQWLFYSRRFNDRVHQLPRIFPNAELPNRVIAVTGKGGRSGFSVLMMDALPSLDTIEKGQCFPLYLYQKDDSDKSAVPLFASAADYRRVDAITDYAVQTFGEAYPSETVGREDIFHYIYGLLHSEDYRGRFRANLAKELPRIPCVKSVEDYRAFRDEGRRLGELHVGYEEVDPYPATIDMDAGSPADNHPEALYRVEKMRHPGAGKNKDRSTVIYNPHITVRDIPEAAWDYVVNGKPALAWVMERQCVRTDKASGIVSDANRYATETVGNPRYPLDLFLRVITVSLETIHREHIHLRTWIYGLKSRLFRVRTDRRNPAQAGNDQHHADSDNRICHVLVREHRRRPEGPIQACVCGNHVGGRHGNPTSVRPDLGGNQQTVQCLASKYPSLGKRQTRCCRA